MREPEKAAELLREDVVLGHGVPRLVGHFVVIIACGWHLAKIALGQQAEFVVVVEDDTAMARHPEVFDKEVAGEDVGRGQVGDGVAVVDHCRRGLRAAHLLDKEVQRVETALGVHVLDDHGIAGDLHGVRRNGLQFVQQLLREAVAVEGEKLELLGVHHPPHAVMLEDEPIAVHHLRARRRFRIGEAVLDDLENHVVGGEREDGHHHALGPARDLELVVGVGHVPVKCAVPLGLAVLVVADGDVQLGHRLERHDTLEKAHHVAGDVGLHMKVAACEAENHAGIILAQQHRVDDDALARRIAQIEQRQDDRQHAVALADAAQQIGAFVAIEDRLEHLHRVEVRCIPQTGEVALHLARHEPGVTVEVVVRDSKAIVEQDRLDHGLQAAHLHITAEDRCDPGRDRGGAEPDKFQRRVDAHGGEDAPRRRIKEGLCQFHVPALADERGVSLLDGDPKLALLRPIAQDHLQPSGQPAQHLLAQVQPLAGVCLPLGPLAALETLRRAAGDRLELAVIIVERLVNRGAGFARQRTQRRISWCHSQWLKQQRLMVSRYGSFAHFLKCLTQ